LAEGSDTNIVVKDKDGKATTEKIEDFLSKTFKKEKPWLYAGSGGSGSGATGSGGSGNEPSVTDAVKEKSLAAKRAVVAGAL
jgi:shikimate 5-dehydrogenase